MARGLPCIGSTVGGFPELLADEDLICPGDISALAAKIREVVTDPERMVRMSARNLAKARDYDGEGLRKRRIEYYCYVREMTETWLKTKQLQG
jgi:glycosyltransferase involved in cell wall biosynthesis